MDISKVTITKFLDDEGAIQTNWHIEGDNTLINVIGMLELTKINLVIEFQMSDDD